MLIVSVSWGQNYRIEITSVIYFFCYDFYAEHELSPFIGYQSNSMSISSGRAEEGRN